jgi:hypothetical protein
VPGAKTATNNAATTSTTSERLRPPQTRCPDNGWMPVVRNKELNREHVAERRRLHDQWYPHTAERHLPTMNSNTPHTVNRQPQHTTQQAHHTRTVRPYRVVASVNAAPLTCSGDR